jgi:hypothetical protein
VLLPIILSVFFLKLDDLLSFFWKFHVNNNLVNFISILAFLLLNVKFVGVPFLLVIIYIFIKNTSVKSYAFILEIIKYLLLFIGAVAIAQLVTQNDLSLSLLNEPTLNIWQENIGKFAANNSLIIRPTGFFDHSNILGFIFGCAFFLFRNEKIYNIPFQSFLLFITAISFSRNAIFSIFIVLAYEYYVVIRSSRRDYKSLVYSVFIIFFLLQILNHSGEHYFMLNNDSGIIYRINEIKNLVGTGIGNIKQMPYELNFSHNGYIVLWNEYSPIIFLSFFLLLFKFFLNKKYISPILVYILVTTLFDHYLFTNFQTVIIAMIFVALYDYKAIKNH